LACGQEGGARAGPGFEGIRNYEAQIIEVPHGSYTRFVHGVDGRLPIRA
jgi:hypothetical protein